jgi:hypothetical protein
MMRAEWDFIAFELALEVGASINVRDGCNAYQRELIPKLCKLHSCACRPRCE